MNPNLAKYRLILKKWCEERSALDIDELVKFTGQFRFFQDLFDLGTESHRIACSKLKCLTYNDKDTIIRNGKILNEVYIVMSGSVYNEDSDGEVIRTFLAGESFGSEHIILKKPIEHNYIAETKTELLLYPSEDFKDILPQLKNDYYFKLSLFTLIYPFSVLPEANMKQLATISPIKQYFINDILFKEFSLPTKIYILVDGCVRIVKAILDKKRQGNIPVFLEIKRISTHAYFGELSVIRETTRFASALAVTKSKVLEIDITNFYQFVTKEVIDEFTELSKRYLSMDTIMNKYNHLRKWDDLRKDANSKYQNKSKSKKK